ncbi:MAG: hypothetical protein HY827_02860 [Actinobacteria bacterium]|nr:hypothetical protein [Actinomycetota bacterium]
MSSNPITARLNDTALRQLESRSTETEISRARLAERYIEEGLRMDAHPGIVFRDGASGRRAALAGGIDVWEMIMIVKDQKGDVDQAIEATAEYLEVSPVVVRTAVRYYLENLEEIDDRLRRNREAVDKHEIAWRNADEALA